MSYNAVLVKRNNILSTLKLLKLNTSSNKSKLANRLGLTNVTMNSIINDLLEKGIVNNEGNAESSGGRKAALYCLNQSCFYVGGVYMAIHKIVVTVYSFGLEPVHRAIWRGNVNDLTIDECVAKICELLFGVLHEINRSLEDLIGMGISVPGIVNYDTGNIANLPKLHKWKHIPLRDLLEKELNLPIFIDNDMNANMLYLKWNNVVKEDTSVFISLNGGIGAGMLINGELYRGNNGVSGEFGHMRVKLNGLACRCGSSGCLELYASDLFLLERILAQAKQQPQSKLFHYHSQGNQAEDYQAVKTAKDEAWLAEIFNEGIGYLSICLGAILSSIAPKEIIIQSDWLEAMPEFSQELIDNLFASTPYFTRYDVKLTTNDIDNIAELGPGAIALDHFLTNLINNPLLDFICSE